jgi:hypothetical protein
MKQKPIKKTEHERMIEFYTKLLTTGSWLFDIAQINWCGRRVQYPTKNGQGG